MNEDGIIVDTNQSAIDVLGKKREEIVGYTIDSVDPNYPVTEFLKFWKDIPFDKHVIFESTHQSTNGALIPVELSAKKYKLNDKIFYYGVARNITERKLAENSLRESELKFRTTFDQSPVGSVIVGLDKRFVKSNASFCKFLGYNEEEIVGHTIAEFTHPDDLEIGMKELQQLVKGTIDSARLQKRYIRKDGATVWGEVSIRVVSDEQKKPLYFLPVIQDITQQKLMEFELIKAKEKAEESDRLKSAFLANMSHEIRTPMNGILGFARLLQEPELTGKERKKYIEIIQKSGDRMLNTVNDIIDISKIESGQMTVTISEVNINEKLVNMHSFFKPEANRKGVELILEDAFFESGLIIQTDEIKLNSVLTNLIKNAIKYCDDERVEFGYKVNENELLFFVKDKGIGISKDRQQAIFERFIQADIEDRDARQGSGLGLAISKAYVDMLGGKIWVESELGKGSVFYFTIPYIDKPNENDKIKDDSTVDENTVENKKLNVLIAEDDPSSVMLLEIMLKPIAKNIWIAGTGIETVEMCRNNQDIDLVLLDIQMPGMNGFEAALQIRQFNRDVVIIAQTAFALSGDNEKAMEAGCNDYISKPINKQRLMKLIGKYAK